MQGPRAVGGPIGFRELARAGPGERVRESRDPVTETEESPDVFEHARGRQTDDPQVTYGESRNAYK